MSKEIPLKSVSVQSIVKGVNYYIYRVKLEQFPQLVKQTNRLRLSKLIKKITLSKPIQLYELMWHTINKAYNSKMHLKTLKD